MPVVSMVCVDCVNWKGCPRECIVDGVPEDCETRGKREYKKQQNTKRFDDEEGE